MELKIKLKLGSRTNVYTNGLCLNRDQNRKNETFLKRYVDVWQDYKEKERKGVAQNLG